MSSQTLIVFKFNSLFNILEEISLELNFKIINVESEKLLNKEIENLNNYLIISNQKNLIINNQIILSDLPMRISKLLEKVNIEFLKLHFNNQSRVKIKLINSRQMLLNDMQLVNWKRNNTILINKPVSIDELQENVWSYQSDVESHSWNSHL